MTLDITTLIVLAGIVIPATVSIIIGLLTYKNTARRQELDETVAQFNALKDLVKVLHDENDELCKDVNELKVENKRQYRLMQEQEDELSNMRRDLAEKDGSLKQLKAWAEMLVKRLTENHIDVPPMPDREATQPRHDVNHDRGGK